MASDLQGSTLSIRGRAYRPIHATYLASLWASQNPRLQRGEIGVEQDTLLFKVGNGVDRWNDLGYATGSPGPQGPEGPQGPQGETGATGATGVSFSTTATIYDSEHPLPSFADTPVNTGYYYQHSNGVYDVYVHLEDEADWFIIENWGGIAGPQGIQGPQGPQGIQGIQGVQGPTGPTGATGPYFTPSVNADTGNISWTNNGGLENPTTVNIKGPQGATGPYFTPFVNSSTGDISWTNNGGLENPSTVNIKGPQGIQGIQGPQGEQGIQGPQGPQGLVITNINVASGSGIVSVSTSASMSNSPTIKTLVGNVAIAGTWSGSDTAWTFTPTSSGEILEGSWIVALQ